MAFGVFTPTQAKIAAEQRTSKDAIRAKEIATITQELLKEKEEIERSFQETIVRQQKIAEQLYEENVAKKKELEAQVEKLEKRRTDALMPLLIKEEDIQSTQDSIRARQLELDERAASLEDEQRVLMRRLDEVSSRIQDLDAREKRVKQMEQGAEFQRNQVANSIKRMNTQMAEFQNKVEEKETAFAYRQSELDAQKNLYDENDKKLIEREKEIAAGKRLLADQRVLLEKGFKELIKLKEKYGNSTDTR
jgi:chromosome segregation ATPase